MVFSKELTEICLVGGTSFYSTNMKFKHADSKIKQLLFSLLYGCLFHASADHLLYILHCTVL